MSVSRRSVLVGGGALALLPTTSFGSYAQSDSGEVVFGVLTPTTGTYGYAGELIRKGAELAVEERGGEILGKKINLVVRDDEGSPAVAVRRLTDMANSDGVRYLIGNYSSNVGLAEAEVAKRLKVLQIASGGSDQFTGERCSRYTFMWSYHAYTILNSILDYMQQIRPDAKRWYTITADYTFGHTLLKYIKLVGEERGIEFIGNEMHPLGERQYNQYLTKVMADKPDVLCLLNGGNDALTCIRQFEGYDAQDVQIVAPWSIELEQMRELTPQINERLIIGLNYFHTIDSDVNRNFVEMYEKKHGAKPSYGDAYGYDTFRTIMLAMEKANSTEVADVIRTMETMEYDSIFGPTTIDAATHQIVRPAYVVQGTDAPIDSGDNLGEIVLEGKKLQPEEINECSDIGEL
jgi:branched-chain amino acid transport system substrate-binding protein